ncbi:MAG: hypothetical protein OEY79_02245 [Anaplasmataceae bacterium]|nr:hypothetical protein [Anaplasmataceae bacterium]
MFGYLKKSITSLRARLISIKTIWRRRRRQTPAAQDQSTLPPEYPPTDNAATITNKAAEGLPYPFNQKFYDYLESHAPTKQEFYNKLARESVAEYVNNNGDLDDAYEIPDEIKEEFFKKIKEAIDTMDWSHDPNHEKAVIPSFKISQRQFKDRFCSRYIEAALSDLREELEQIKESKELDTGFKTVKEEEYDKEIVRLENEISNIENGMLPKSALEDMTCKLNEEVGKRNWNHDMDVYADTSQVVMRVKRENTVLPFSDLNGMSIRDMVNARVNVGTLVTRLLDIDYAHYITADGMVDPNNKKALVDIIVRKILGTRDGDGKIRHRGEFDDISSKEIRDDIREEIKAMVFDSVNSYESPLEGLDVVSLKNNFDMNRITPNSSPNNRGSVGSEISF